jgi:hypothetical protein
VRSSGSGQVLSGGEWHKNGTIDLGRGRIDQGDSARPFEGFAPTMPGRLPTRSRSSAALYLEALVHRHRSR